MWTRALFALSLATLLAVMNAIGCGGDDLLIGSSQPPIPTASSGTPTPTTCGQAGDACNTGADCCSGSCDPFLAECQ